MPGPSPVVRARLKPELHRQFEAARQARGMSASELIQQAVKRELEFLSSSTDRDSAYYPRIGTPSSEHDASKTRLTVRLPRYVRHAASELAKTRGLAISSWIASLVQSQVAATPVLTADELEIVDASNRELAAVGRNINQIARALNEAHFQVERVRLDRLAYLAEKIEDVRQAISTLVRASRNAWGVAE